MLTRLVASTLLALGRAISAQDVMTPDNLNAFVESSVQIRTHSLFAPYVDQDLQNRWFSFGADAYVNTNKHIRLTQDRQSETGWLWSRLPISSTNYQIDVEFKISSASSHLYGDGMAMWLTTRRAMSGPVFGFENNFDGIGIFIDTFANEPHSYAFPRISAMIGDGNTPYDVGKDGDKTVAAGCSANIRGLEIATKLRITYIKGKFLDVKVQYKAWDDWTPCFTLENPRMPPSPFLGFSALTGEVSESHDIIAITTSSLILNQDLVAHAGSSRNSGRGRAPSSGRGFFGTLFSLILRLIFFGAIVAVAFVGWRAYGARLKGFANGGIGAGGVGGYGKGSVVWDSKRF